MLQIKLINAKLKDLLSSSVLEPASYGKSDEFNENQKQDSGS